MLLGYQRYRSRETFDRQTSAPECWDRIPNVPQVIIGGNTVHDVFGIDQCVSLSL